MKLHPVVEKKPTSSVFFQARAQIEQVAAFHLQGGARVWSWSPGIPVLVSIVLHLSPQCGVHQNARTPLGERVSLRPP